MNNTNRPALFLALILSAVLAGGCAGKFGTGQDGSSKSAGQVVDDSMITSKVKAALLADPDIGGLKINVDTAKGVVTLKGEIKTLALRRKAESLVRGVEGVQSVNNQLVVTG